LAAQFTPEQVATLRFVPALRGVMEWAYEKWGNAIYKDLSKHKTTIEAYLEQEGIELNKKQRESLFALQTWQKQHDLMIVAERLMEAIGDELSLDFNQFLVAVDTALKLLQIKLSNSEKNQILNAVSLRDESAVGVIKKIHKLKGDALTEVLTDLDTTKEYLPDFGYWPGDKSGQWIEYEPDSELRETENVPLKEDIHARSPPAHLTTYPPAPSCGSSFSSQIFG
jgi:type I restriction enzyme M protein